MVKKIRCKYAPEDHISAHCDFCVPGNDIRLDITVDGEDERIYLTPENARKLRKQIKKALAEIDGESGESETEDSPEGAPDGAQANWVPKVGEIVVVYRNTTDHKFIIGEHVRALGYGMAEHLDGHDYWWCGADIRPLTA